MEILGQFSHHLGWFLVVLTIVVFFHELGHYAVARSCNVRVDIFSIGFGRELFGFTDSSGTHWKVGLIPLGGYVKFFGDAGVASDQDAGLTKEMNEAERHVSFHHKRLRQKIAIVSAGPIANFVLSIVILTLIFVVSGRPYTPPVVGMVVDNSAASEAGLKVGDTIVGINRSQIHRFEEIQDIVIFNPGKTLDLLVIRDGSEVELSATPRRSEVTDNLGNVHQIGLLGIGVGSREYKQLMIAPALIAAVGETYGLIKRTLQGLGQIIMGTRSVQELGGPVLIAQMSGDQAANGPLSFFNFVVILSVTLGLINLFPVPVLDGGHLLFYTIEAIRGRPLGARTQEYAYFLGLAAIVSLMIFTTVNDLSRPAVVEFFQNLFG
ncbi:MAG: Metalloprotease MmpA [Alphaproteobacteria bacterium MarineAlpha9_Bin7]|nr:MAG: Metalloprotease MmpA [Alphaproteobacteria bacterium MarineAlpha9_Bin7]